MKENSINIDNINAEEFLNQGKTVLYFGDENRVLGIIAVSDTIKETSYDAIKNLKKQNLEVVMLTGDNEKSAKAIGNELGISKIISEVLPQDKEKEVEKLQKEGKKVAFVGDGINDSPALVRSDVGLAIGSGTDIAIESADIVLIKNSLIDVVNSIKLSRATINNIKLSLFLAFIYNIIGIPIAARSILFEFWIKIKSNDWSSCYEYEFCMCSYKCIKT